MNIVEAIGKLILRLALGFLVLLHGIAKIAGGVDPITAMLQGIGLPAFLAFGVYIGEIVAPILLLIGWYARVGAGLIAINMIFAFVLAHQGQYLDLTAQGGWALELQGMYLFTALALVLLGPGRLGINNR